MKRMEKILNGPAPTLGLAMAASCLFMWGRNWHMYTWSSLGFSLALVLGAGSLLGLLVGRLAWACGRAGSKWPAVLPGVLVGGLLVMTLLVFLFIPFGPMAAQLGLRTRHLVFPLALVVFLALYAARGFRLVNIFLVVWLLISLAGGLINIHSAPAEEKIAEAGFMTEAGHSVALKRKPDIYLYFLESYHSPYAMRLLYGHDAGPMAEYLRGKNFMLYDRTLSNSHRTIESMLDTFTMRLSQNIARGNDDVMPQVRRALGGNDDNHLFKILKDNGYHITFITMDTTNYFFHDKGANLDATDVNSCLVTPLIDLCPVIFTPLGVLYLNWRGEGRWFVGTRAERVRQAVEGGRRRGGPFMVVFKGGAWHPSSVSGIFHGTRQEFETWKPEYLEEAVARGDAEMKEIIEYLDETDPGALIILIGDHGTWGHSAAFFDESRKTGDVAKFRRQLTERGVTLDEAVQDIFGAFLAIRLPGGEQLDISQGLALNHVNLFRHVFAYLNDDRNLLSGREPALSVSHKLVLGRDNQPVLERYEDAK
jgi:hypothetical protein